MSEKKKQTREQELDEAIEDMDAALAAANGECAKRVRGRTTATRRALLRIAGAEETKTE